ncbi:SDR family oxidoreductase [Phanerochaete sordida]|uniref:SDR family oxidoreductase n=1 Tax=Phanerochaete sordida TaxID=48140 RepID=A0A9P3G161_9APHY|nr:SDR family oxidoreductase [Phanerochaete sordida]
MSDLQRKVVLVTGCSKGGIGFALCEEYARRGCKVYATARRLEAMEGFAHPAIEKLSLDVTSDENVQDVVKTIIEREGRIDMVVNNAGANCAGAIIDVPLDSVQRTFDANFLSVLRVCKAVFPHMAARRSGTIVNVGSIVGETPTPWNGIYAASKAALHQITHVLWMECKPFDIDVVLLIPGAVKSNIANTALSAGSLVPDDSLYKPFEPQIVNRVLASQGSSSMPTIEFSRQVVDSTLLPKPPRSIMIGGSTFLWKLFAWLPKTWVLNRLWKRFLTVPK